MSYIMLLVRTSNIKAFTFTPKIIHILLDYLIRETSQEGRVLRSRESIACALT